MSGGLRVGRVCFCVSTQAKVLRTIFSPYNGFRRIYAQVLDINDFRRGKACPCPQWGQAQGIVPTKIVKSV